MENPNAYQHIAALLTTEELQKVRELSVTASFTDGKATATDAARSVKNNMQLQQESAVNMQLQQIILQALNRSSVFRNITFPRHIYPFLFSKYKQGMEYGWHVDSPLMGELLRTDIAITIFLNHPDEYDGGELELQSNAGTLMYKLPAGDAVCYPCTQLHRVKPVLKGERRVAVSWIQSLVRSSEHRIVLREMQEVISSLRKKEQTEEANLLQQTHSNLLRMWAE